jgi:phosphoglycolate phosphatase
MPMRTVQFGERLFECELVIFDKDGTLIDFKKTWIPIFRKRLEIVMENLPSEMDFAKIVSELYRLYGIRGQAVDPYGPLPYSTEWEDEIMFASVLYKYGLPWQKAKETALHAIQKTEKVLERGKITELYDGVAGLLTDLRRNNVFIGMATADFIEVTINILKHVKIFDLFDYVVGADMVEHPKPEPEMVNKAIEALNVSGRHTALVGDSVIDMEMGRRADIGLVVGVLEGGVAREADLKKDADVVIGSIRDIKVL